MNNTFGELVKQKLIERGMSQRTLAMMTGSSSTYINYLVRGINPSTGKGAMQPSVDVVSVIAYTLGIPKDEALRAAGLDPNVGWRSPDTPNRQEKPKVPVTEAAGDQQLFDIAYKAALEAVKSRPIVPGTVLQPAPDGVKMEIPGKLEIILLDAVNDLTPAEIGRYEQAFLEAYESVTRQIAAEKR